MVLISSMSLDVFALLPKLNDLSAFKCNVEYLYLLTLNVLKTPFKWIKTTKDKIALFFCSIDSHCFEISNMKNSKNMK